MRRLAPVLALILAACGDGPEEVAHARCLAEVRDAFRGAGDLAAADGPAPKFRDHAVYGRHMDIDVRVADTAGNTHRAGYRCLFETEGREAPLFLAVIER